MTSAERRIRMEDTVSAAVDVLGRRGPWAGKGALPCPRLDVLPCC